MEGNFEIKKLVHRKCVAQKNYTKVMKELKLAAGCFLKKSH
jgi:hypothetical protein